MTAPGRMNSVRPEDRAVHEWYRFVLSFPPHLVQDYLDRFGIGPGKTVLDPFAGTGTTLVECKKRAIASIGIESNPMAQFASAVKLDWSVDPAALADFAAGVSAEARRNLARDGCSDWGGLPLFASHEAARAELRTLAPALRKLLLKDSISPLPLHKTLVLLAFRRCRHYFAAIPERKGLHENDPAGVGHPRIDRGCRQSARAQEEPHPIQHPRRVPE